MSKDMTLSEVRATYGVEAYKRARRILDERMAMVVTMRFRNPKCTKPWPKIHEMPLSGEGGLLAPHLWPDDLRFADIVTVSLGDEEL